MAFILIAFGSLIGLMLLGFGLGCMEHAISAPDRKPLAPAGAAVAEVTAQPLPMQGEVHVGADASRAVARSELPARAESTAEVSLAQRLAMEHINS